MSKLETIKALKRSAIESFSKHGYEGASLREIANHAGVPLSAVHLYFGSKCELYTAVGQQVWTELEQERNELLCTIIGHRDAKALSLSDVVYALAYPVVRRALSDCEYDQASLWMVRGSVPRHHRDHNVEVSQSSDKEIQRWMDAIMSSCSGLSRAELVWAYSFVVGAIYSWQLLDHRYDKFLEHEERVTTQEVVGDIVAFCCSGIQAMIDRRQSSTDVQLHRERHSLGRVS